MKRLLIAAEWLEDGNKDWWFYSKALNKNNGKSDILLIGNANFYNEKDRNSLPGHILYILKTLYFSFRLCFISRSGDVIFTWNQLPALIVAAIFRLTGRNRNIICQNFLYRSSSSAIVDFFRRGIYNFSLKYKYLHISLQGSELYSYYRQKCSLQLNKQRCYFVPDCYPDNRVPDSIVKGSTTIEGSDKYIFTGGEANRDWALVMEVARKMPEYNFCCVARKRFFDPALIIPDNVTIHWDTSLEEYFRLLAGCKISLIPIKDKYNPAGILLLFDSVTLNKSVVSSDTPYLTPYLDVYSNELCFANAEEAVTKIKFLDSLSNLDELKNSIKQNIIAQDADTYVNTHLEKFYQLSEIN